MKGDRVEMAKGVEARKIDEKMDIDPREIDGAKAKKTSKPTVKPTTPPKPTVPPTTKKPAEKKDVLEREEAPKGKTHVARSLSEMSNVVPPGRIATTLLRPNGPKEMGRDLPQSIEKSIPVSSSQSKKGEEDPRLIDRDDPRKPSIDQDADPCHDGLSPRCTPPSAKPVEMPPTIKPVEYEYAIKQKIHTVKRNLDIGKEDADPCHDGLSPRCTPPTSKPVEHASKQSASLPRTLAAVPVKVTKDDADPCHDGLSPRCTPPTSKPVEHKVRRILAGSPTKSPSSGLHKPTWKPSSKPNEHRSLSGKTDKPSEKGKTNKPAEKATKVGAALPRSLSAVPVTKDDADPCHDGLSPRCTPPTSKPVEHASKQSASLPRTLAAVPVKVTKDDSDPCHDGLSPRCTPPTSKPVEHASK